MYVPVKTRRIYKILKEYDWDIQDWCNDINNYAKNNRMSSTYTMQLFEKQFKKVFGCFNTKEEKTNRKNTETY